MWTFILFYIAAVAFADDYIQQYTSQNFKNKIRENRGTFVMFYAPWCSHCTDFHPIWNQLAELINSPETDFRIAQVDCTVDHNLCRESDITGYPTLLYYKQNSFKPSEYRGTRDLPSLTIYLNEVMAVANEASEVTKKVNEEVKVYKGMAYLTDQNFDKFVAKGQHFILFYAPWCAVSQTLAPTWSVLAEKYVQNESVQISKIDCMEHRATCLNFDIKDYPHLLWMVKGKVMQALTGLKSIDELLNFVETMALPENHKPEKYMKKKTSLPIARISEDTFDLYMKQDLVFINYFAAWCAHCKLMVPTWLELARTFQTDDQIIIADVDCGQDHALCIQEDVHQFPTLILYKKSKVSFQHNGSMMLDDLVQEIMKNLLDLPDSDENKPAKDEL